MWYQKKGWWESGPTTAYYKGLMSILTGEPYPLRVLNASCSNPLSATRNPKKVAEALKKLDFMFVMDVSHAPHVDFADIVLPACTSYEQGDFFCTRNTREGVWVGGYNKVVEPLGESRSDWRFYLDLAVRMGYGEHFWQGSMDGLTNEMLARYGVTAEQLRQNPGGILVARSDPPGGAREYRKYSTLFKDLPQGKVQCYNELIGGQESCDESGHAALLPRLQGPARRTRRNAGTGEGVPADPKRRPCPPPIPAQLLPQCRLPARAAALSLAQDQSGDCGEARHRRRRLGESRVPVWLVQTQGRVLRCHQP